MIAQWVNMGAWLFLLSIPNYTEIITEFSELVTPAFISIALKQYDFCHAKNQRDENEYWIKNNKVIIKNLTEM